MRNLVIDFDLTVLWPLILLALIVLWNSVRTYLKSRSDCKASIERLKGTFETLKEGEEFLEWGRSRCQEKHKSEEFIWISSGMVAILCALMLMPDKWKVVAAHWLFNALWFVSVVSFVIAISMAWRYARKLDWLRVGVCLFVMLMAAASAEHFLHQEINARHIACPHCSQDDDPPDDDN